MGINRTRILRMNTLKTLALIAALSCAGRAAAQQVGGMVRIEADPRIEQLLRLRVDNNSDGRKVDGYVIQIYYGRKQQAAGILEAFRESYPLEHAEMEYDTPDYKVFVGAYRDEQQAREALALLKQNPDYSGAFVRAKKITVYDW